MQDSAVPHRPKLQYRTRSSDSAGLPRSDSISLVSPLSTTFSLATVSTAPTSPSSPDHGSTSSSEKPNLEIASVADDRPQFNSPSHHSPKLPEKNSKKGGGSFFRFFNVKEPSQEAFDDYQRQMRKKGYKKDGKANAIGLPGVSSAKLPPTVPKVNSRWDGIPQAVKEKEKQKHAKASLPIGGSSRSIGTSGSERSTSTTTSSTRSRGSSLNSKTRGLQHAHAAHVADLYGWEAASESSGSFTKAEIKAHDEALQLSSIKRSPRAHFIIASQVPPLPSTLPKEYLKKTPADNGLPVGPTFCSSSPTRNNNRSSPIASSLSDRSSYVQPDHFLDDRLRSTRIEIPDINEITINSKGIHILGPPVSAGPKARDSPFPASEADEMSMPSKKASPDGTCTTQATSLTSSPIDPFHVSFNGVDSGRRSAQGSSRDTANKDGSAYGYFGGGTNSISQAVAPWEEPSPMTNNDLAESCRHLPTLDGGHKLTKKSMMVFSIK